MVNLLAPKAGERILDLGSGTGVLTAEIASRGADILGVDRSEEMISQARRKFPALKFEVLDARQLRFNAEFDAVFSSFALELFDSPEIPRVLAEVRRVLRPGGRVGVVSMAKGDGTSVLLRLYEWAHKMLPQFVDCRPIYLEQAVKDAGFRVWQVERVSLLGLPGEIVVGSPL